MTATCTRCGRVWNISIRTSPTGYVCLDCEYREKLVRAGVIRPVETGGRKECINERLTSAPAKVGG